MGCSGAKEKKGSEDDMRGYDDTPSPIQPQQQDAEPVAVPSPASMSTRSQNSQSKSPLQNGLSPRSQVASPRASLDEHIYALRHVSTKYLSSDFEKKNGPRIVTSSDRILCQTFWRATKTPEGFYLLESMSTGGYLGSDERGRIRLEMSPEDNSQWLCQATKGGQAKRVHFKHRRQKRYLSLHQDGRWILAEGPDEARTGFDLELLKTISNNVMRSFDLHAVDGRADSQIFTDILHRQFACFLTYSKDMSGVATTLHQLRLVNDEELLDIQARTYHAVTSKIMKELPLLSDRLFKFLDINDDMFLSRSEFEIILSLVPQSVAANENEDTHTEALFKVMDVDESGTVVREEVVEFFRALLTCLVDFVHMGVDIMKKTVNQIFIPKMVETLFEQLDANQDGTVNLAEAQGFLEELMHRDETLRNKVINMRYAVLGVSSEAEVASEQQALEILTEILNLVGDTGMTRESFLDMMSHLGDNALNRILNRSPDLLSEGQVPEKMKNAMKLYPQLMEQFNRLVRSKKDELFSAYFRVLDRNCDGVVEPEEFEMAVRLLQPGSAEEKISQLFAIFDINGDGQITQEETETILSSMVDLGAEFAHIIIDVSIKLLNEDVVEDVVWAMVMAYSDEDKDGFDLVEFKEALDAVKADLAMSFQNPTGGVREFPDLFDSWRELASEAGCRDEGVEKWWGEILAQYSLPQRTYHNMNHLRDIFRVYKEVRAHLASPLAVGLSIFFHEIVYEPTADDNELQSAILCQDFANDVGLPGGVLNAMMSIIDHGHDISDGSNGSANPDIVYFNDLKLSVLGRDAEEYDTYVAKIRQEYAHLGDDEFLSSRADVLQRLLETRIYRTDVVSGKYEQRARFNVARELEHLAQQGYQ